MDSLVLKDISQEEFNNLRFDKILRSLSIISKYITYIPENYTFPKNIIDIKISKTHIKDLPLKVFERCIHLESLDLSENDLTIFNNVLPIRTTSLNLSFNAIEHLELTSRTLEFIDTSFNNLSNVPECLLLLTDANINITFNSFNVNDGYGNNNRYYFPPEENMNRIGLILYNNYQIINNVHARPVVSRTMKIIDKLMSLNLKTYTYSKTIRKIYKITKLEYFFKKIYVSDSTYRELDSLMKSKYKYQYDYDNDIKITYNILIKNVVAFIFTLDEHLIINLVENFKIQIKDGIGYCNVGKVSRIVNTLLGLLDIEEKFEMPINIRLANKIEELKNKHRTNINAVITDFKIYMGNLELSPEETEIWLQPLYEELE
jgi:Leucine-rich repeat (LRR) protein